jgi:hypothetical protein
VSEQHYEYRGVVPQTADPDGPTVTLGTTTDRAALSLIAMRDMYPGAAVRRERRLVVTHGWVLDDETDQERAARINAT